MSNTSVRKGEKVGKIRKFWQDLKGRCRFQINDVKILVMFDEINDVKSLIMFESSLQKMIPLCTFLHSDQAYYRRILQVGKIRGKTLPAAFRLSGVLITGHHISKPLARMNSLFSKSTPCQHPGRRDLARR